MSLAKLSGNWLQPTHNNQDTQKLTLKQTDRIFLKNKHENKHTKT